MENLVVWILIFAGATIGLLATFLLASERQLQQAEEQEAQVKSNQTADAAQLSTYATPRGEEFHAGEPHNELVREITKLNNEIKSSQAMVTELQEWLVHSQRRQQDLTERADRLETELDAYRRQPKTASRADEGRREETLIELNAPQSETVVTHPPVSREQHEELTRAAERLRQQGAEDCARIDELEGARRQLVESNRATNEDNQRLRAQVDELRQQLQGCNEARERWQHAHMVLGGIAAKQAACAGSAQEVQHALLQLTEFMVSGNSAQLSAPTPEPAKDSHDDPVELSERQVFFSPPLADNRADRRLRHRTDTRADMASSALAITVFVFAIGILVSQTWRLNPAEPPANGDGTSAQKSLSNGKAGATERTTGEPPQKQTAQLTEANADERVEAQAGTK
ncbi:MAG: hypothetical protein FJ145_16540 [Deltaproteobacteria bacterium]|nr:hypothetical protein [Deltaproteobacteria bacterium]